MTRRSLRRSVATVCTAVFAAGILGVAASGPAGGQIATPGPPGTGVTITVIEEVEPLPIGPLSFT